ncbi:MAG: hypothetical protein IJG97_07035 [Bacilli bacterium]|nr:hypothetical protein [Bacilli bacterium]
MKNGKRSVLVVTLLIFCFMYLVVRGIQAAYESTITGRVSNTLADWSIKVNNQEITNSSLESIPLTYTVNDLTNVRSGKVAPGSNLSYPIQIDASGSEVAVKLTFTVTDKTVDPDKYLTLTSVSSSDLSVIRVGANAYCVVIPKASLSGVKTISMNFSWVDDGSLVEYSDEIDSDNFMEINLNAIQYVGETITPYNE